MSRTDGFLPHADDWGKLGQFIGRNTHIIEIKFCSLMGSMFNSETRDFDDDAMFDGGSGPNLPRIRQFQDFCRGLANNTSIKKVDFHDTPMILGEGRQTDGYGLAYTLMSDWFENNVVEEISMPVCYCEDGNYDNSGELGKMATVLAEFNSLKRFDVVFDDEHGGDDPCEVSADIINALSRHTNLEDVRLSHGYTKWSSRGYAALARFLSGSKVKKLGLEGGLSNEVLVAVSAALVGNDTLKEIYLDDYNIEENVSAAGWKTFAKLLDNDSGSIMDTYNSNHTIQKLFSDEDGQQGVLGDELHSLLNVNSLCNKYDAARIKIIMRHLSGEFMDRFTSLDVAAMPYALAWMGRTNADVASLYTFADADLCLMYKFVRGVAPVLFDAKALSLAGKRKAQQA